MCHHDLLLPSPVLQIVFAPPPHCNDFLALLASGEVAVFCCRELHTQGNTPPSPELAGITRYPLVCVEHFLSRCQLQPSDCMVQTHFMQTWWLPLLSALSEAAGVVARVATVGSCHGGGGGGCSGTLTTLGQRHTLCGGQHMVSAYASTLFVCSSLLSSSFLPPLPPHLPSSPSSQLHHPLPRTFALPHGQPRHPDCCSTTHRWHHPQI